MSAETATTVFRQRTSKASGHPSPARDDQRSHGKGAISEHKGKGNGLGTEALIFAVMIISHGMIIYFFLCAKYNDGCVMGKDLAWSVFTEHWSDFLPTTRAATLYFGFLIAQLLFATYCPGPIVYGLPVRKTGERLPYLCNGVWAWYLSLVGIAVLHWLDIVRMEEWIEQHGAIYATSAIFGNIVTFAIYMGAYLTNNVMEEASGYPLLDSFAGIWLHPRIGVVDLKMFFEIRISWILLFIFTTSAAALQFKLHGLVTPSMAFMVLAHFLYTNACHKGEECIPTTWDITTEGWGWMLIWWNQAGVPCWYSISSYMLAYLPPVERSPWVIAAMVVTLLTAYYIWDTANSQKNRLRMMENGSYIERRTFPVLPWGTLHNPKLIRCRNGGTLLVDGWYQYLSKPHYAADIVMSFLWGFSVYNYFLPYTYLLFFAPFLMHRTMRDEQRMREKYGADYDEYRRQVPYTLIYGIW